MLYPSRVRIALFIELRSAILTRGHYIKLCSKLIMIHRCPPNRVNVELMRLVHRASFDLFAWYPKCGMFAGYWVMSQICSIFEDENPLTVGYDNMALESAPYLIKAKHKDHSHTQQSTFVIQETYRSHK